MARGSNNAKKTHTHTHTQKNKKATKAKVNRTRQQSLETKWAGARRQLQAVLALAAHLPKNNSGRGTGQLSGVFFETDFFKKSVKAAVPDDGNPLGALVLTKLGE